MMVFENLLIVRSLLFRRGNPKPRLVTEATVFCLQKQKADPKACLENGQL